MSWKDQVILVTGGNGSFDKKFVEIKLEGFHPRKMIIFSCDELKQHEMRLVGFGHAPLRCFSGESRGGFPFHSRRTHRMERLGAGWPRRAETLLRWRDQILPASQLSRGRNPC